MCVFEESKWLVYVPLALHTSEKDSVVTERRGPKVVAVTPFELRNEGISCHTAPMMPWQAKIAQGWQSPDGEGGGDCCKARVTNLVSGSPILPIESEDCETR